ncbi:hypothetical protein BGX33_010414 [Mortierella sp. NVP41]|nr:hypothetical protein BGX33_010414 [Mortierella sp. NVP41]
MSPRKISESTSRNMKEISFLWVRFGENESQENDEDEEGGSSIGIKRKAIIQFYVAAASYAANYFYDGQEPLGSVMHVRYLVD